MGLASWGNFLLRDLKWHQGTEHSTIGEEGIKLASGVKKKYKNNTNFKNFYTLTSFFLLLKLFVDHLASEDRFKGTYAVDLRVTMITANETVVRGCKERTSLFPGEPPEITTWLSL